MVATPPKAPAQEEKQRKQSPIERVLALLPSAKPCANGFIAQCPAHGDKTPSLAIWEDKDGHCGLKCYAGCSRTAICDALGLAETDLYLSGRARKQTSSRNITLMGLATDKNIDPRLLLSWGVSDNHTWIDAKNKRYPGVIRIRYDRADGSEHTQARIRTSLTARMGSFWEGKGALIPYGLNWLSEAREAGYCWIVEGESDVWTLRSRKLPALGIPGATNVNALQSGMLDGIPQVYIVTEPDKAGGDFPARIVKRLREIDYTGQCFSVSLQALYQAKDPNDLLKKLWRENRISEFPAFMQTAKDAAQLVEEEDAGSEPDASTIIAEIEQTIQEAIETKQASALYALVNKLVQVEKAEQARMKSLIRDGAKHCPGFSLHDFNALFKDAQAQQTRKEAAERVYTSGRAQILLGRQLEEEKIDALDTLHKANTRTPRLFVRGRRLCRIVQDENKRTAIEIMGEDALIAHMAEIADFVSYNAERDTYSSQHPTARLAKTILASSQHWRFPALVGLTEIPVMRSDGTIFDTPGYDEQTRLYYQPLAGLVIPPVPTNPSKLEVLRARDFAFSFFSQFSYASQADRANAYGLVLALVMMEIARPALATLLTAASRGEGKGLFTDALSTVASGFPAHTTTLPRDDTELKKELLGRLADGETFISFDNITGTVASRELDSFLTATNWGGRLLGSNTNLAAEKSRVFTLLNGNNVMLGGDLSRRILPIRLASGSSRPWERPITYKYSPLLKHIEENRGAIIAALLTMVRGWHLAGRPLATIRDESCFGPWKRAIGGILKFLEIDGFLGNLDTLIEDAAQEDTQWLRFLQTWYETIEKPVTVKEFFALLETDEELRDSLPDRLAKYYVHEDAKKQNPRSFGFALGQKKDTPYGPNNLKLTKGPKDTHKQQDTWKVTSLLFKPDGEPSQTTCGIDSQKCGIDSPEINQSRNQSSRGEQAPEANGKHLAGLSGIDSPIFTCEKKNKIFLNGSENKEKNILFSYIEEENTKSIPLNPANEVDPASENASDMRDRLRDRTFSSQSIPQSDKSIPQTDCDLLEQVIQKASVAKAKNSTQKWHWSALGSGFPNGMLSLDAYIERLRQCLSSDDRNRVQAAHAEMNERLGL